MENNDLKILNKCVDYKILKENLNINTLKKIDEILIHYEEFMKETYDKVEDNDFRQELYIKKYGNDYIIEWYEGLLTTDDIIYEIKNNNYLGGNNNE